MKPLVYWAGPYTAVPSRRTAILGDVKSNVQRAQRWASEINLTGLVYVVLPHVCSYGIEPSLSEEDWRAMTLELSRRCEGILLDPLWRHSDGSVGEQALCLAEDRPIVECTTLFHVRDSVRFLVDEIEHRRAMQRAALVSLPREVTE